MRCLHILFSTQSGKPKQKPKLRAPHDARKLLQDRILCNTSYTKLTLDAERVACALFFDYGLKIVGLIDAQSLLTRKSSRRSISLLLHLLGGEQKVDRQTVLNVFDRRLRGDKDERAVVLRAWATGRISVGGAYATSISAVSPIDTKSLDEKLLMAMANSPAKLDN
ncbi:hypothetical protein BC835DRAFT_1000434 [Cytidiella melzeri]|nr:hypothetical protein BC835DRAFT_1000434 [Cytidiella melzeri]